MPVPFYTQHRVPFKTTFWILKIQVQFVSLFPSFSFHAALTTFHFVVLRYIINAKYDALGAANIFMERAEELSGKGMALRVSNLVYSTSAINQIRCAIRIFFMKFSVSISRIIDDVLKEIEALQRAFPKADIEKTSVTKKCELLSNDLNISFPCVFLPLLDDSMASVVHPNGDDLFISKKELVVRISGCGKTNVNGDYILSNPNLTLMKDFTSTDKNICFESTSGFQLTRSRRRLRKDKGKVGRIGMCLSRQIDIFDWYILSPHLSSSYYCCSTFHRSTLPPLSGWRPMDHGALPGPTVDILSSKSLLRQRGTSCQTQLMVSLSRKKFQPTFLNDLESGDDDSDAHVTEVRCRVGIFRRNEFIRIRNPQNRIISDEGLSTVKALYIVCNLRKGLARSMDSPHQLGAQKSFSFAPTIIDQDDNKTSFEKINESFYSVVIREKIGSRRTQLDLQFREVSRRIEKLSEGNIDHLLYSTSSWPDSSMGYPIDKKTVSPECNRQVIQQLRDTWSLESLISVHTCQANNYSQVLNSIIPSLETSIERWTSNSGDSEGFDQTCEKIEDGDNTVSEVSEECDVCHDEGKNNLVNAGTRAQENGMCIDNFEFCPKAKFGSFTANRYDAGQVQRHADSRMYMLDNCDDEKCQVNSSSGIPTSCKISGSTQEVIGDCKHDILSRLNSKHILDEFLSYEHSKGSKQHNAKVSVLGAEMWPLKRFLHTKEGLHYVIRIQLNDFRVLVPRSPVKATSDGSVFEAFSSAFTKILSSRIGLDSRHVFTVRRDIQSIVALHTELGRLLKELKDHHDMNILLPSFPDAFAMGQVEDSFNRDYKYSQTKDPAKFLGSQPFVYNSAGRTDSDDQSRMVSCMSALQDYLQSVFSLMESIDDHTADLNSPFFLSFDVVNTTREWRKNRSEGLQKFLLGLGQLIGIFLQAIDSQDIVELRNTDNSKQDSLNTVLEGDFECSSSFAFVKKRRPCWYTFATEGLRLHLQVHDDQGGRLSLRDDDELLRRQRFKCLGCGEPLQSLFFGVDQNYLPCRYTGGLFCKRWCHSNDHRVIPHRLLLYWDCVPHRVCQQARKFLDDLWQKPLLHVDDTNSLLYEGIPAFTLTRNLRHRLASIFETMLDIDVQSAINISIRILGEANLHFVVFNEYYSLQDIVGINSGETQKLLKKYTQKLSQIDPRRFHGTVELDDTVLAANTPHPIAVGIGKFIQDFSDALIESISL